MINATALVERAAVNHDTCISTINKYKESLESSVRDVKETYRQNRKALAKQYRKDVRQTRRPAISSERLQESSVPEVKNQVDMSGLTIVNTVSLSHS